MEYKWNRVVVNVYYFVCDNWEWQRLSVGGCTGLAWPGLGLTELDTCLPCERDGEPHWYSRHLVVIDFAVGEFRLSQPTTTREYTGRGPWYTTTLVNVAWLCTLSTHTTRRDWHWHWIGLSRLSGHIITAVVAWLSSTSVLSCLLVSSPWFID